MTFSSEKPTVPGLYGWKRTYNLPTELVIVKKRDHGGLVACHSPSPSALGASIDDLCGLWSPRLVPVEEVEKAFREGSNGVLGSLHEPVVSVVNQSWAHSRAKRIVEGKE